MSTADSNSNNRIGAGIEDSPETAMQMELSCDESDNDGEEDRGMAGDDDGQDDDGTQNKQPRLMRACDHCRRKKVKCNGTKPSCTHCTRMKLACHYSPLVRKKRTRRSLIDKLEERLESMEQMLQPLVERLTPNDPIMGAAAGRSDLGLSLASAHAVGIAHSLGIPLPTTSQFPGAQSQQHYAGFIPQFGMPSIPHDALYAPAPAPNDGPPGPPMPPHHVVEELVELALARLAPAQPPISLPTVLRRLRSGKLPEYIICGCIAIAARFSNRPEFNCTPRYNAGREYAKRAAELVSGLIDKPDPDVVFCMVMLSLYEWGCGLGESAWSYTGMATRLAQRLRLHLVDETDFTENEEGRDTSWGSTEWKRRMWWCVYISDRTSLIVASRPATVHDDDYVVNLPTYDHEWVTGTLPSDNRRSTGEAREAASPESSNPSAISSASDDPFDRIGSPAAQQQNRDQESGCRSDNKIPDSLWLVVELYRTCSRISEFSNRRRRPVRPNDISRRTMFDILDRELEDLRSRFMPFMEFPPRTEWLLKGYASLGSGINGMLSIHSTYFNIHLMYYAAKIILYRSELPEYEHEIIEPELIARAKAVCVDSAHKQAEVIRWAFDNIPVENWDPKIGVWSLQGASIHVNAALTDDNLVAEQARKDLEIHLRLHVESDKYYHFNMAIITMLHRVFNLRKQQRLAMSVEHQGDNKEDSAEKHGADGNKVVVAAPASSKIDLFIRHKTDQDPWIVPRCSSLLGFTYNYSQLRGILNKTIKQTTYSPPDSINADGTAASGENHQDASSLASSFAVSVSLLNDHTTQTAVSQPSSVSAHYPPLAVSPAPNAAAMDIDRRMSADTNASVAPGIGLDISGGLWYGLPSATSQHNNPNGSNISAMAQSLPAGIQGLDIHHMQLQQHRRQHSGLNAMTQQQMGFSTIGGGMGSLSSPHALPNMSVASLAASSASMAAVGHGGGPSHSAKRALNNIEATAPLPSMSPTEQAPESLHSNGNSGANPVPAKKGGKKSGAKSKGKDAVGGDRGGGRKFAKAAAAASSSTGKNSQVVSQKSEGVKRIEQLQRLEELRARVSLLQQLSSNNNNSTGGDGNLQQGQAAGSMGPSNESPLSSTIGTHPIMNPLAATAHTSGVKTSLPSLPTAAQNNDVNGFLNTFAASIGSMASQLGSNNLPNASPSPSASASASESNTNTNKSTPVPHGNSSNMAINTATSSSSWLGGGANGMTDAATAAMVGVESGSAGHYSLPNIGSAEMQMMLAHLAPLSADNSSHAEELLDHTQQQYQHQQQQQHAVPSQNSVANGALNINPMLLGINPDMGYSSADVQKIMQKLSSTFDSSGSNEAV
ncbi:hypothetical protein IWW48_004532 [Coemansia sp. RSA 1200]|nr:hypothetical protein IWW48_004532 [Coemansia sp. RSA 1200]